MTLLCIYFLIICTALSVLSFFLFLFIFCELIALEVSFPERGINLSLSLSRIDARLYFPALKSLRVRLKNERVSLDPPPASRPSRDLDPVTGAFRSESPIIITHEITQYRVLLFPTSRSRGRWSMIRSAITGESPSRRVSHEQDISRFARRP